MPIYDPQGRWRIWRDGQPDVLLPEWISYKVQVTRSGPGGFELVLPIDGVNVDEMIADLWIALGYEVLDDDGSWNEPPSCRFLPTTRKIDTTAGTLTLSGASWGWLLGKAVRWPDPYFDNADGKAEFDNASAGAILQWHYYWAIMRKALRNITIDFDAAADSDGTAWVERYDVEYDRGVTLRQIFDGFTADGIIWRTYGDTIQVAQGEFADVPADIPVMRAGIEVEPAVVQVDLTSAAGAVLLVANDTYARAAKPAIGPFGRWETSVSQGGTTGDGTLERMARMELSTYGAAEPSATLTLLPSCELRPFDTVRVGMFATVRMNYDEGRVWRWDISRWDSDETLGSGGTWSSEITGRIDEMTITDDGTHAEVALTIGERSRSPQELLTESALGASGGRVTRRPLSGRTAT